MKYWKRAAGALKDKNSIWQAGLARKSIYRNPDLETAIIKATSHDETRVDYKNMQRVFTWVQTSPRFFRPLVWALSARMDRTRCWVVALKGLMLMHGVYCCKIPSIQKVGRLPFDLSDFHDTHSKPAKTWGYDAFIRAYFTFLDQKSSFISNHNTVEKGRKKLPKSNDESRTTGGEQPLAVDLETLQKLQYLLDLLIQVKPQDEGMRMVLILEAMDCIIIEISDVHNKICKYVARVSSKIYEANRYEATLALKLLHQANKQAEELSEFIDFCMFLGVLNASECPKVVQVHEDEIRDAQRIVDELWEQKSLIDKNNEEHDTSNSNVCNEKAIVGRPSYDLVVSPSSSTQESTLTTVVTDKWEIFEDDLSINGGIAMDTASAYHDNVSNVCYMSSTTSNALAIVPHDSYHHVQPHKQEIPDLISF